MNLVLFQKGFNFSQDGPGNRLVLHLQGCNMRCPWCSNPEGMEFLKDKYCRAFPRFTMDVDTLVREIIDCSPMFFDGGGVTLTGGEPTLQFSPVLKLLSALKKNQINTAVETNASSPRLPELFPFIDFLMADFKHYDAEKHRKTTGAGNRAVKQNIKTAVVNKKNIALRIPLINGFNASKEDITGFLNFFKELDKDYFTVELLRYHEYGRHKWEKCGLEYTVRDGCVSGGAVNAFKEAFSAAGIKVVET